MARSTIRAIVKSTFMNLPGRGHIFILFLDTVRKKVRELKISPRMSVRDLQKHFGVTKCPNIQLNTTSMSFRSPNYKRKFLKFTIHYICSLCTQRLGCDSMLDSGQQEDACLQCGGNSQSCHLIRNTFTMRDLPNGNTHTQP